MTEELKPSQLGREAYETEEAWVEAREKEYTEVQAQAEEVGGVVAWTPEAGYKVISEEEATKPEYQAVAPEEIPVPAPPEPEPAVVEEPPEVPTIASEIEAEAEAIGRERWGMTKERWVLERMQERGIPLPEQVAYISKHPELRAVAPVRAVRESIEEYHALEGEAQFKKAIELGLIPEGSKYAGEFDGTWRYYLPRRPVPERDIPLPPALLPVEVKFDVVVIGTAPALGMVLVKNTSTGEMYYKPATSKQLAEATSIIKAERKYGLPYIPPAGETASRPIAGLFTSDTIKAQKDYIYNLDRATISIEDGVPLVSQEAYDELTKMRSDLPLEVYDYRGVPVKLTQSQIDRMARLSGEAQFSMMVDAGIIEKGSEYQPLEEGKWGYIPPWQVAERRKLESKIASGEVIQLPDGKYIEKADADRIKEVSTQGYTVLIDKGYNAFQQWQAGITSELVRAEETRVDVERQFLAEDVYTRGQIIWHALNPSLWMKILQTPHLADWMAHKLDYNELTREQQDIILNHYASLWGTLFGIPVPKVIESGFPIGLFQQTPEIRGFEKYEDWVASNIGLMEVANPLTRITSLQTAGLITGQQVAEIYRYEYPAIGEVRPSVGDENWEEWISNWNKQTLETQEGRAQGFWDSLTDEQKTEAARYFRHLPETSAEGKLAVGFVPILGTYAYWNEMTPVWRGVSIAGDVLFFALPFIIPRVTGFVDDAVKALKGVGKVQHADDVARALSTYTGDIFDTLNRSSPDLLPQFRQVTEAMAQYGDDLARAGEYAEAVLKAQSIIDDIDDMVASGKVSLPSRQLAAIRTTQIGNLRKWQALLDQTQMASTASGRSLRVITTTYADDIIRTFGLDDPALFRVTDPGIDIDAVLRSLRDMPDDIMRTVRTTAEALADPKALDVVNLRNALIVAEQRLAEARLKFKPSEVTDLISDVSELRAKLFIAEIGDITKISGDIANLRGAVKTLERLVADAQTANSPYLPDLQKLLTETTNRLNYLETVLSDVMKWQKLEWLGKPLTRGPIATMAPPRAITPVAAPAVSVELMKPAILPAILMAVGKAIAIDATLSPAQITKIEPMIIRIIETAMPSVVQPITQEVIDEMAKIGVSKASELAPSLAEGVITEAEFRAAIEEIIAPEPAPIPEPIPTPVPTPIPTPAPAPVFITPTAYPKPIPTVMIRVAGEEVRRAELPSGAIAWAQGFDWKFIPPPYNQLKPISLGRIPPLGARNTDSYRPSETIQIIGQARGVPRRIDIDLGWADIAIHDGQRIEFEAGGLDTDIGMRLPSPTVGMSVGEEGGEVRRPALRGIVKRGETMLYNEEEPETVVISPEQEIPRELVIEAREEEAEEEERDEDLSDLVEVSHEDIMGDGEGEDLSDLVDVPDEDLWGPSPEPKKRFRITPKGRRTTRREPPPTSFGGTRG